MLSENVYVNQGGQNYSKVLQSWAFIWRCPKCNQQYLITKDIIEDFLNSDPHDPLYDYISCPNCEYMKSLMSGVEVWCHSTPSLLRSDGTFIYLKAFGREDRIV